MPMKLSRRALLAGSAVLPVVASFVPLARAQQAVGPRLGDPRPFDRSMLVDRARTLAAEPYEAPEPKAVEALDAIDYDAYNVVRYRPDRALWLGETRHP